MVLPVDIVVGVYLGLLSGIIPAVVAFGLGFLFRYVTGVTVPAFGVVVLALAIAGVNGGFLALIDPTITASANAPSVVTALIVVLMLSLFAHNRGDALGGTLPKRITLRGLRERTLSADVVELVGGRSQVRVEVVGEVTDIEGMPPLSDDLRAAIRGSEWLFAADLTLDELETQLVDRLRAAHDLSEVSVAVDGEGRASVSAAPPSADVSKRVPRGKRAVSVEALVPTGIARGDEVTVHAAGRSVAGTVVSASSGDGRDRPGPAGSPATDGGSPAGGEELRTVAPTTTGGGGRLTLAVDASQTESLMRVRNTEALVVVEPRGVRREYELLSMLRRAGHRFRKVTLSDEVFSGADRPTVAAFREQHGVAVLAVEKPGTLTIAPGAETGLERGDRLYLVGPRGPLDDVTEGAE